MMTQSLRRPFGKGVIFGAIGGFVGGLVMYAIMSVVMLAIDMGANCFAVIIALITGQQYSNSQVPLGVSVHLITSTVIGAIFGLVTSGSIAETRIEKGLPFRVQDKWATIGDEERPWHIHLNMDGVTEARFVKEVNQRTEDKVTVYNFLIRKAIC